MNDLIPLTLVISIVVISIISSLSTLNQIGDETIMPLINSYNECLNNSNGGDCIGRFFYECNKLDKEYGDLIVINCEGLFTDKLGSHFELWGDN